MQPAVTVIGAGIVGVCTASYLQRAGCKVRLVDRDAPGMATSFGNAGGLSSGAFVPISYPGILQQVPKWLTDPEGPLVVRPGYLPKALPWLTRFVMRRAAGAFERSGHAIKPLTMSLFDNLVPLAREAPVPST